MFVTDFLDEYDKYRRLGENAMAQASDEALNRIVAADGNSIAMLVRHVSGNLVSRFTDFLTTDGEKPSRDRDDEFAERSYSRDDVNRQRAHRTPFVLGTSSCPSSRTAMRNARASALKPASAR